VDTLGKGEAQQMRHPLGVGTENFCKVLAMLLVAIDSISFFQINLAPVHFVLICKALLVV
jgi:hypothetical protein